MHPDATVPVGFTIADVDLPAPHPGSVEAGLIDAGLGEAITLTDIRTQSAFMQTPLPDAFDAVFSARP